MKQDKRQTAKADDTERQKGTAKAVKGLVAQTSPAQEYGRPDKQENITQKQQHRRFQQCHKKTEPDTGLGAKIQDDKVAGRFERAVSARKRVGDTPTRKGQNQNQRYDKLPLVLADKPAEIAPERKEIDPHTQIYAAKIRRIPRYGA